MTATAPLYRAEVPLGLGLDAQVEIVEIDPLAPPAAGADWPTERDWPRARLTVTLPGGGESSYAGQSYSPRLAPALRCPVDVLGERCGSGPYGSMWGSGPYVATPKETAPVSLSIEDTAARLPDLVSRLIARADADLAPLIAHVAKRAARLEQRAATLAAGRAAIPAPDARPIELDAGPRATSPSADPSSDDSSQRFALLELDATLQPARARRRKVA